MTKSSLQKVLIIGYGNPAREDDGLGPAFAEALEQCGIIDVTIESNYQLTVEDAAAVADHDVVIFIDSSVDGEKPFSFTHLFPKPMDSFTSHSVGPETVLCLARELFGAVTKGYMLCIRGYSFAMFKETMTEKASENLKKTFDFLIPVLRSQSFHEAAHYDEKEQTVSREGKHEKWEICDFMY